MAQIVKSVPHTCEVLSLTPVHICMHNNVVMGVESKWVFRAHWPPRLDYLGNDLTNKKLSTKREGV